LALLYTVCSPCCIHLNLVDGRNRNEGWILMRNTKSVGYNGFKDQVVVRDRTEHRKSEQDHQERTPIDHSTIKSLGASVCFEYLKLKNIMQNSVTALPVNYTLRLIVFVLNLIRLYEILLLATVGI